MTVTEKLSESHLGTTVTLFLSSRSLLPFPTKFDRGGRHCSSSARSSFCSVVW